ncbi:hypothetical protein COLO4_07365 [Corchorus olitorius]|uniref:Uncharacterized protein n=1 Tax=Corchorus olitorius TaxID=93759 RepID=A0A1R3KK23_9ROSI|nr:hypothetical protein COLO4_07365 [Corchorus olitorius]
MASLQISLSHPLHTRSSSQKNLLNLPHFPSFSLALSLTFPAL